MKFEAPRGTQDLLPGTEPVREAIVDAAKRTARNYGYQRVITPTFEDTSLFLRTVGETSDVVQREMYSFEDQSGRSLTLRPEGTAPIARVYVQHGLHKLPQPVKLYYISPMFRYARSQRGRYREFWQIGLEAVGSPDPLVDAELITCFRDLATEVGTTPLRLELNSIGDRTCRPAYIRELRRFLRGRQLPPEARARLRANPLGLFDLKDPQVVELLASAPRITDFLCDECDEHFHLVRSYLRAQGVRFRLVPTLVRGLDYYTRTVWEFKNDRLGSQSSVCAGGRYDYLVEEIGGAPTPSVGWAAGIERIELSLDKPQRFSRPQLDIFVMFEDFSRKREILPLIRDLRRTWSCEISFGDRRPRKQFADAARRGARTILIVPSGQSLIVRRRSEQRRFVSSTSLRRYLERVLK